MKHLILLTLMLTGCASTRLTPSERELIYTQAHSVILLQEAVIAIGVRVAELERPRYILDSTWSGGRCPGACHDGGCTLAYCKPYWIVDTVWVK